jgi:hypothetical protein
VQIAGLIDDDLIRVADVAPAEVCIAWLSRRRSHHQRVRHRRQQPRLTHPDPGGSGARRAFPCDSC